MSHVTTGTILDKILDQTARDVAVRKTQTSIEQLRAKGQSRPDPVSLHEVLVVPGMSVIAEIKRASPSRGEFPVQVDPAVVAADYIAGGAAAISVLTDEPFFKGSLQDMEQAAQVAHASARPVAILRKDFLIDPYQVAEAWAYGADAVLLIVAALSDEQLRELMAVVDQYGLEALVEVHDESEMARAIALGARNLGINNRDLHTFKVDLATTERLAPLAPDGSVVIGESGVFGPVEIERLWKAGARAVLVGEGVIVQPDRAAAVRNLRESVAV
jgi:indole-3-glycerol phosphate synthase